MSDKQVLYHQRDVNNPPSHLEPSQQQSWIRAAKKAKKNHELQQQYPKFTIPTAMYEVKYVNKHTTLDTMQLLINHVEHCEEYSIDTEGDKSTKELALIQIQSIPDESPMFVIIVELSHLPSYGSPSKVMIKKLFRLIFRSGNKIHTWGSLERELSLIKNNELFNWPIEATQYNIQTLFSDWYNWALSQCGISSPYRGHTTDVNNVSCLCHRPSPYRVGELWSLQLALIYVIGLFIDKSTTLYDWSRLLDPSYSTLSFTTREKLTRYVIYDCFATTYFVKPVLEYWTFKELTKVNIAELFITSLKSSSIINKNDNNIKNNFKKNKKINKNINGQILMNVLDDDIELNSEHEDDEILVCQCISTSINNDGFYEIILNNDDVIASPGKQNTREIIQHDQIYDDVSDDEPEIGLNNNNVIIYDDVYDGESSSKRPRVSKHQTRSVEARHKINRKRNMTHRKRRYRYAIRRRFYYRFTMFLIRNVLQQYNIRYIHVKIDEDRSKDELVIGLKDKLSKIEAERRLPDNIFSKQGYYHYQRLHKR